jgi:ribosomal protein S18 acetylase RimI-like enzyme
VSDNHLYSDGVIRILVPTIQEIERIASYQGEVAKPESWADGYPTEGDLLLATLTLAEGFVLPTPQEPWGMLQIELAGFRKIVGGIGFKSRPIGSSIEIGYGVSESYQNKGIATAAVMGMLAIAKKLELEEVSAETDLHNIASQRVLQKCGFKMANNSEELEPTHIRWLKNL